MKFLVTGAAGFLGSHLVEKLLASGHKVDALDDFSSGRIVNLQAFLKNSSLKIITSDVRNQISGNYDVIMNLACPASPKFYQMDPVRTLETNILGMTNVLRLAKETGAIVVQASTSEIYGDPLISPQVESYWGNVNPIGIRSCYDEGKRAAETLCFDYYRQFDVDARVVRIFNTYGPNMASDDGRVVSNFIVQALTGSPITIYGDGNQTRSFCYVSDLIDALYRVALLKQNLQKPINLGNPDEFTIEELAHKVLQEVGSASELIYKNIPLDDPKQRKPDISLAKQYLNWTPMVNLDVGLRSTIEYFRNDLNV